MSAEIYHFFRVSDLPNRIRELRMAATPRLSQQALADRIGTSKPTISDLETGKMMLTQDYMRRISQALGVTSADLLPISENADALSAEERLIIERLRQARDDQRAQVKAMIDVLLPPDNGSSEPSRRRA